MVGFAFSLLFVFVLAFLVGGFKLLMKWRAARRMSRRIAKHIPFPRIVPIHATDTRSCQRLKRTMNAHAIRRWRERRVI